MTISQEEGSFELWEATIRGIIKRPTKPLRLLDLCCNECSATRRLKCSVHVGVDITNWTTRKGETEFVQADVLDYLATTKDKSFDVAICSDGIEHLVKTRGFELLREMPRVAPLAIIFTPLGPWMLDESATHPDKHKSGWWPDELEKERWQVASFPKYHPALNCGAFFAWKGQL